MRRVSVCSIVGSGLVCSSALPILPSSVRGPVAAISTMPCPDVTRVPENTEGKSSPPGRSSARASADGTLRTGTDSPVSSDSSVERCSARRRRPSAGTRSPSARTTRSPRTTSRPAMRRRSPSRITRARGLERSRSASSACSVRRSWTIVMVMTTNTKPSSISASVGSPMRRYTTPAATSMRNIGSRTTSRTMVSRLRFCCAGSSFGPSCCKRARASSSRRPTSPSIWRTLAVGGVCTGKGDPVSGNSLTSLDRVGAGGAEFECHHPHRGWHVQMQ